MRKVEAVVDRVKAVSSDIGSGICTVVENGVELSVQVKGTGGERATKLVWVPHLEGGGEREGDGGEGRDLAVVLMERARREMRCVDWP